MSKRTGSGIICPRLLDKYTYLEVPRTEEQCYELTWDDFRKMSPKLDGKPLCSMHGDIPVGKITRNWTTSDGKWWIDFEIDEGQLAGFDMSKQVEAGTLNALSLKHHHGEKEPYEVSLVFEPARDGSMILRDGTKNPESYKASGATPVQGWTRETVIQAARGSMAHIRLHNDADSKHKSDLSFVSAGAGGLQSLEHAEALIAREQQKASDAAKQAEDARKAIEVAKRREANAQQHKQMDSGRKDELSLPQQIPSAGDQMRMQVESQVQHAAGGGGSMAMPMDEGDDHSAASAQLQQQVDRQTVAASAGGAAPPPKRITGDADVDAILHDPSVSAGVKERLIASMEKRHAEEKKWKQEAETAKAAHEKEKSQFRENYIAHTVAFQKAMLAKFDPQAADDMAKRARSGALDDHIMSPAGQMEIAAQKSALKMARKTQQVEQSMSEELLARAQALGKSLGDGAPPGVAHSFAPSSYGGVVAAGRGSMKMQEEDEDEGMGLGMPKEFKKPSGKDDKQVIEAGKIRSGTGFGQSAGKGGIFASWNQRVEESFRRNAIDQMAARSLMVPGSLPASHPVVISAGKGGIGSMPKSSATDEKGGDDSWCAGLGPDYFHPDALKLVVGDGSDVPHDFTLFPEDPDGTGMDLGGASKGSTSSRKRVKFSS